MGHRWRPRPDERGQAAFSVVAAIVTVLLAGVLVNRVAWTAEAINKKAGNIARTAVPVNEATDAVLNIDRTNELAGSILETATPLQGKLAEIVRLATSVDRLAKSINSRAGEIDGTAKNINGEVGGILATARSLDSGVKQIIANLDTTLGILTPVTADADNILGLARTAHKLAACIDQTLPGNSADPHCSDR
ncbi:MAG: hypothetical protein ACRD1K_18125 [Acidimicrobiales bacterium]